MEKTDVKVPLGIALLLNEIVNKLLYVEVEVDGKKEVRNRGDLPFRLLYRLNRNAAALSRDLQLFNDHKTQITARCSTIVNTDSGDVQVVLDPEKASMYHEDMNALLESPVKHNIVLLEPEDIDKITANIVINPESMRIFIAYMTDDKDFLDDLSNPFKVTLPKREETIAENIPSVKVEEENVSTAELRSDDSLEKVDGKVETAEVTPKKATRKRTSKKPDVAVEVKVDSEIEIKEEVKPSTKKTTSTSKKSTSTVKKPVEKSSEKAVKKSTTKKKSSKEPSEN